MIRLGMAMTSLIGVYGSSSGNSTGLDKVLVIQLTSHWSVAISVGLAYHQGLLKSESYRGFASSTVGACRWIHLRESSGQSR